VTVLGTLSYLILLTMLMGSMYLAIDATAGERERGSLRPLLTMPVPRAQLILGRSSPPAPMIPLAPSVAAFALLLRFTGLERFGMSINLGPWVALRVILYCLPLVPLAAALATIVAPHAPRGAVVPGCGAAGADPAAGIRRRAWPAAQTAVDGAAVPEPALPDLEPAAR
jgi:sodium transport system permease protein